MSKGKHTAGPWYLEQVHDDGRFAVVTDDKTICDTLNDTQDSEEEHHANANLIAAAPEMYEELEFLVTSCIQQSPEMFYSDGTPYTEERIHAYPGAIRRIRELLKKARGENGK